MRFESGQPCWLPTFLIGLALADHAEVHTYQTTQIAMLDLTPDEEFE